MKILLADLAHNYAVDETSLTVPLGIGYIKAYALAHHGNSISIDLFKDPENFLKAADQTHPDIIGFANYGWNENLNRIIGSYLRAQHPDTLIVAGGPNIDPDPELQAAFLAKHDYLDLIIIDGGEESFSEIIEWRLSNDGNLDLLPPNIVRLADGKIIATPVRALSKQITNIESPYLGGHLDEFLHAGMVPMFETNRGCPFKCSFCAWGSASKDLVRRMDLDTSIEEIRYVGQRTNARNWIFCDANFGILKRDIEIAREIRKVRDETGFPLKCHIWMAKNATARNLEIGEIFGDMTVPVMAIQSLSEPVLEAIKRDNISTDTYLQFQQKFHSLGSRTYSDLIVPLPNETLDSHLTGLRQLMSFGVDIVMSHNMRLLAGAETNSSDTRQKYKFKTRYRLIHGDSGQYHAPDGTILRCFEYEESLRSTSTMSEQELFFLRKLHFLVDFAWNSEVYKSLLSTLLKYDVDPIDLFIKLLRKASEEPQAMAGKMAKTKSFFDAFEAASNTEWFDTAEEIEAYFFEPKNFRKLINQEFEKLNIQFALRLLHDCKDAFDTALLTLAQEEKIVPHRELQEAAEFAFNQFPSINAKYGSNLVVLNTDVQQLAVGDIVAADKSKNIQTKIKFFEGTRRQAMCELIRTTQGKSLSKMMNTQGYGLRDLRCESEVISGEPA